MMGFGPMGGGAGGNSSSSSSNLSASAPPFTVDRLNPKPNSSPLLPYSEYAGDSFGHPWQYARPSAPRPEVAINSTGITSGLLSDDYRYSAPASIGPSSTHWSAVSPGAKAPGNAYAYGGEVEPYHSPYIPPFVGEGSLLVEDEGSHYARVPSVTSQTDYTKSLFDLECGPRWMDRLGYDDQKWAKRLELDQSFTSEKANVGGSHSYEYQLNQGGYSTENRNKSKEDSGVSYQKFNQVTDRKVDTSSLSVGQVEGKPCPAQDLGFFPYDSNTHILASSSTYPGPQPSVLSTHKSFLNYQNSCSLNENCVKPVDTLFAGPASVLRSSPTVVIRPPPTASGNLGQSIVSRKPACSGNTGGVLNVDFDHSNPSKQKDSGSKSNSEIRENSFETNLLDFSKQGSGLTPLSSVKERASVLPSKDTFDRNIKARFGSQLPYVNVSSGFVMACDKAQVVNSPEDSSDFIDQHNLAVDSPCWKGAPSSQISLFDVEAGNIYHAKKLDGYYGFNDEELQNLHSVVDSNGAFSEKVGEGSKKNEVECPRNAVALPSERTFDAICSSKEQSLLGDAKGRVWISTLTCEGAQTRDDPNMPRKERGLLDNLTSGFGTKVSDTTCSIGEGVAGLAPNDASEGGAVAVHAAEKVLASPASQEDATEGTKPPDPKLNVPTMIKAMHNLSELLLLHLSNDACFLEEENTETLKIIISNLNSCLSKKIVLATNKLEPNNPMGDNSEKLGESRDAGTISGSPHMKNEAVDSHITLDSVHMHEEERNYSFSCKKDEKSPTFSPSRDDLDITRDDEMAKAIKKVLEENFHFNEEMHSQALLFKSLWLEAEAKLCSISYKARFDRMKIQMDQIKDKAPQENDDTAEMMSKFCIPIDPIKASELAPSAHDLSIPKPTLQNIAISSTSGHADIIEAPVMARFNILKSREDNLKPSNMEEEQRPEMVDGEHADSIMDRFNILKSHEENSKTFSMLEEQQPETVDGEHADSIMGSFNILKLREENSNLMGSMEEEKQPEMVDGEHADSIMARFNILKSREENSKLLISMEEEEQPEMIDGDFSGEKYLSLSQSDYEALNFALKPHYQTGNLSAGKFGSYADGSGYGYLNESHLSVPDDPTMRSFKNSRMIDQNTWGWHDGSSSDWEHVVQDDFTSKNV